MYICVCVSGGKWIISAFRDLISYGEGWMEGVITGIRIYEEIHSFYLCCKSKVSHMWKEDCMIHVHKQQCYMVVRYGLWMKKTIQRLEKNEARRFYWMRNVSEQMQQSASILREMLGIRESRCSVQERKQYWFSHVIHMV